MLFSERQLQRLYSVFAVHQAAFAKFGINRSAVHKLANLFFSHGSHCGKIEALRAKDQIVADAYQFSGESSIASDTSHFYK